MESEKMASEKNITLIEGGVYQTDLSTSPIHIISFNDAQVYYDTWWEHLNDWGYKDSLKKKVFYYRTRPNRILNGSEFLRVEPLSDAEKKVYRPDLPFFVCRNAALSWTDKTYATIEEYEKYLISKSVDTKSITGLNIAEIILVPFDLKGNPKKSILIKAMNGNEFSGIELLWHAHNIQAPYISEDTKEGVGLHRLGFEKGLPSFYIGEYYDSGGSLKEAETKV
jgi:hypothetical protein